MQLGDLMTKRDSLDLRISEVRRKIDELQSAKHWLDQLGEGNDA